MDGRHMLCFMKQYMFLLSATCKCLMSLMSQSCDLSLMFLVCLVRSI